MRACNCARASPFQSTHPRGVRLPSGYRQCPGRARFNPRTRVGCDLRPQGGPDVAGGVSIHAPAWGATRRPKARSCPGLCFNPRTRVGCDRQDGLIDLDDALFQSTHPRGVRLVALLAAERFTTVSIHAPAWGATACANTRKVTPISFNPRTRVGCDLSQASVAWSSNQVSIHAPAWGATAVATWLVCAGMLFQSTHPRGVRRNERIGQAVNKFAALLAAICARIGSRKAKSKAGEIPPFFVSPVVVWGMAESAGEGAGANPFSGSGHSGTVAACAALPGPNWPAGMLHACRS